VKIIAKNIERIISMIFCHIRFIDSVHFMNSSLAALVQNLDKSCPDIHYRFLHTNRHFKRVDISLFVNGANKLLYAKGVYPYEYIDCLERLDETKLPPKDSFYNTPTESDISEDDFERAHQIWKIFKCKTLRDYHDHYLMTDVLLLSDVFEEYRNTCMMHYGLDPAHYLTLSRYS